MAKTLRQAITRFKKFQDIPGMDNELDLILTQINDQIGSLDLSYGELYQMEDDPITITISSGGTYYLCSSFLKGRFYKVAMTTKEIRLKKSADYKVDVSVSFTHAANNSTVVCSVFKNAVRSKKLTTSKEVLTAGDICSLNLTGIIDCKESDKLEIKFTADNTGDITINHINFNLIQVP